MAGGDIGMVVHCHLRGPALAELAGWVAAGELAWRLVVIRFQLVESDCRCVAAMSDGVMGGVLGFQE